jgi:hypothetical protein
MPVTNAVADAALNKVGPAMTTLVLQDYYLGA